jgi:hypothetical protein
MPDSTVCCSAGWSQAVGERDGPAGVEIFVDVEPIDLR